MTDAEVFAELACRGADLAVVEFCGGSGEGGAASVTLYRGDHQVRVLCAWADDGKASTAQEADDRRADERLSDALCQILSDRYGTFAGDLTVTGHVIWDVEHRGVSVVEDAQLPYDAVEDWL